MTCMNCIAEGDIEVIDLWEEGDGAQEVMLYKRPILKVLRELVGDERLAGCQHFAFVLYKDEKGERILACDEGKHLTGDRVRILLLTLPFVLRDLIAPEVCI